MPIGQCALVARVAYLRDEDLNTEMLVLEDEGSTDRIEIQRALTFDSQDVAQGMDTYCLVRGGAAHYGGMVRWVVHSNELTLELDDAVGVDARSSDRALDPNRRSGSRTAAAASPAAVPHDRMICAPGVLGAMGPHSGRAE